MPQTATARTPDSEPVPIVGVSERTRQLLRNVERLARLRCPLLVLGETGTGKGLLAKTLYDAAPEGPFVVIDCTSIVPTLMESELFGHAKGAFTGATGAKTGLIEMAHRGTAFFDEIGELPLEMQVKLLRVLEEKQFRPVGSTVTRESDFRIIAATNRDLLQEVKRGAFRADLYYRLSVVTVRVAPLRERPEDIPVLIDHFLKRYPGNYQLTDEARQALLDYPWPGNVRELQNFVHQMVAVNSGPLIDTANLPSQVRNHLRSRSVASLAGAIASASDFSPPGIGFTDAHPVIPLAELERRAILHALRHTKGDRNLAAVLLGIGRTTLYRKLKEYNVSDSEGV
jgi:DNA-binding NtrC family response regulator